MSTQRIEAFSDGVFAICITLLVLGIAVPELTSDAVARGELLPAVLALGPKILSYAISFAVIGIFWAGHHIMFHYIARSDRVLIWLNTLFLMVVSFIPFPAALLGRYGGERAAVIVYGVTLFLAGLMMNVLWGYASYNHRLTDRKMSEERRRLAWTVLIAGPVLYAVSILVAFVDPLWSMMIYGLITIGYVIPSPIDRLTNFQDRE